MISLKRYTGAKIVAYSIMTLSVMILAGLPTIFLFAIYQNLDFPQINFSFALTIIMSAFGFFSAKIYLKKKKWSRISLLVTCIIYLVTGVDAAITDYLLLGYVKWFFLIPVCFSFYGVWYLLTGESKDWLAS